MYSGSLLDEDDVPRTPVAPRTYNASSASSQLSSSVANHRPSVSLWKIIQAQQTQLNRIQQQIDKLIVSVGGSVPERIDSCDWMYASQSYMKQRRAIASAPASLGMLCGVDEPISYTPALDSDEDDENLMSPDVARLVRKYSTQLRP